MDLSSIDHWRSTSSTSEHKHKCGIDISSSSHDVIKICLVVERDLLFPSVLTWFLIIQVDFHKFIYTRNTLNQETKFPQLKQHILLILEVFIYLCRPFNRQCSSCYFDVSIMLSPRFCFYEVSNLVCYQDYITIKPNSTNH